MQPAVWIQDSDYLGRPRSAFRRGASSRPLAVWVDVGSLTSSTDLTHLLGFARHNQVDVYSSEPLDGGHRVTLEVHGGQAGATVDGSRSLRGGSVDTYRRLTSRWAPAMSEDERKALLTTALLATVAERRADAFVTGAQSLFPQPASQGHRAEMRMQRANPMGVLEALALIGLHLRSADDFTLSMTPGDLQDCSRWAFYWLLARELLPSWGPSWRNLVPDSLDRGGLLNGLGHALIVRAGHVLRARDRVHLELKLPPDIESADEALFALDGLFVSLDACFDVMARVLNRYHNIGKDSGARWRDDGWVANLTKKDSRLSKVLAPGGPFADVVVLIGALRRSLHGVPSQTIACSEGFRGDVENLLVVPPEEQEKVLKVIGRRGGDACWGVRPGIDDLIFVDLRIFVEALSRSALEAIETAVANVVGPDAEFDPRGDWSDTPELRHQLRALSGTVGWNERQGTSSNGSLERP